MTDQTRQIIDFAYDDNAKDMRDALYSTIHDKVMAHIEAHKKDIAQNLIAPEAKFATQEQQPEVPVEVSAENQ
jgi:hypothetical protein